MPKISQERTERPSPMKADRGARRHPQIKTEPQDEVPSLRLSAKLNIKDEPQILDMELRDSMSMHQETTTKREDTDSEGDVNSWDNHQECPRRFTVEYENPSPAEDNIDGPEVKEEHFAGDADGSETDPEDNMALIDEIHSAEFDNYGPPIRTSDWLPHNSPGRYKRYCRHAFYTDHKDQYRRLQFWDKNNDDGRPYHYCDYNGSDFNEIYSSIYFRNADQSNYYYNAFDRTSRFTFPNGMIITSNNANVNAERALYCFPCDALD